MANVFDVAAYILEKIPGKMSTWKLQKLVYYSQAWHIAWEEKRLFPEKIEAWFAGPVVPKLFYSHRGKFDIDRKELIKGNSDNLLPNEKESIDIVLDSYSVTRLDTDKRIINNKPSFQIVEVIELPFDLKEVFEYSFNLDNRIAAKFDYEYIVVEKLNESKLEETVNVLDLVSLDLIDSLNSFSAEERAMMGKDEIQKELDSIRKSMLPEERFSNLFIDSKILFEPYASVSFGVADSPYLIRTRLGVELLFPFSVGSIPSKLTSQSFLSASISAGFLNKAITRVEGNISYDSKLGYVGFSAMVDYGILLHFNPSWAVKLTLGGGISYYDSFHFSVSTGCGVLIPAGTGRLDVTLNAEWMHSLSDDSSIRFALIVGYLFKGF